MTELLGMPLDTATNVMERAGKTVECREVSCRKGNPGSDLRVVSVREEEGKTILLYSGFRTTIDT